VPRLKSLGHDMIVSAFYGIQGMTITGGGGIPILPGASDPYGNDILGEHARRSDADLVVTLMDAWVLAGSLEQTRGLKIANWMPVDCSPLGVMDRRYLQQSGSVPIAMTRYGQAALEKAGFKALYVPHGVDMQRTYRPVRDRMQMRRELGLPEDAFIVGINGANKDTIRKSYPAQMRAFAEFRRRHPDANALLLIHALPQVPGALDLQAIITDQELGQCVRFSDWYTYVTGQIKPTNLGAWYNAIDLLSNASHGEGFGLPIIEAAACGTPAVVTDHSAMTELCGAGWTVNGEPFWNGQLAHIIGHNAWWKTPTAVGPDFTDIRAEITALKERGVDLTALDVAVSRMEAETAGIVDVYERAWKEKLDGTAEVRRKEAREFALAYDADLVLEKYWKPALDELEAM
jgi:glycosyltransferase involved in cell wall biosynthesis